ncbi:MAG: hypothetical protein C5B55_04330, partial [Blastocatellia bacterium]
MKAPRKARRAVAITLLVLFIYSCVPKAHAHPHHQNPRPKPSFLPINLGVAGDFDLDLRQDRLLLRSNVNDKTIEFQFGNYRKSEIAFTANHDNSGSLLAGDFDQDGDVDLVWVSRSETRDAVVFLNDGDGNFAVSSDSYLHHQIDDLLNGNVPSNSHKLKRGRKTSALSSATFHDLGLPLLHPFESAYSSVTPSVAFEGQIPKSRFSSHIRKRGPPSPL